MDNIYFSVISEDLINPRFSPPQKNIAPLVAAGLVAAGSSILGGMMNGASNEYASNQMRAANRETNLMNREIARETNQANLDLYREQFEDSMKYLEHQEKYNSAPSQVQRLREAGLNPSLAFGQGNVSSATSLPQAAPAVGYTEQMAPTEAYSDTFMQGVLQALPVVSDSLQKMSTFQQSNIDNPLLLFDSSHHA